MSLRTIGWRRWGLFGACVALAIAQSCLTGSSSTNTGNRPQYLGVFTQDATISSVGGVLVTDVVAQRAADVAGIRANDILARMDGSVITGLADLRAKIAAKALGSTASFVFFRSTQGGL